MDVVSDKPGICPKCDMKLVPTGTVKHGKMAEEHWARMHAVARAGSNMLQRIIDFSLRNKLIVLLGTLALVLGGSLSPYVTFRWMRFLICRMCRSSFTREWAGQAPQIMQDQVTYPITTKMLSVPKAKVVRGYSFYGFSFVYVIFEDGTDPYWARSRVLEYLSGIGGQLPAGVSPFARTGRHWCRLGVHVFHQFHQPRPG